MKYLLLTLLLSCSTTPPASKSSKLVCKDLNQGAQFKYLDHYSPDFQKSLPQEQLAEVFSQVQAKYGNCSEVVEFKSSINGDRFSTKHENGQIIDFTLIEKNSKITGLWVLGEKAKPVNYKDYQAAYEDFKSLSRPSMLLLKDEKTILSLNESKRTPLGSIFKLFVLDSLYQDIKMNKLQWADELSIKAGLKSLPSGEFQKAEDGKTFSLDEYALKMISISDNTATDHLIDKLGRTTIERQIKKRGFKLSYGWNRPFLTTKELFQVRAQFDAKDYQQYARNTTTGRLLQLQKVSTLKNDVIMQKLSNWQTPRGIMDTEWFSTPKDICRLLKIFDENNDEKIGSILSHNTPFTNKDLFDHVYYKGGSEPGVLQIAYLFKKDQTRYCLYLGSHDLQNAIDEAVFFEKVKGIIKLIQAEIPED